MQAYELPTYDEIEKHALEHLDRARNELSEARDWLRSDWHPVGSPRPADAGDADGVIGFIGGAKRLIDQAKYELDRP